MDKKTSDERYHVVHEAISGAFLLLLKEKPLDKIRVADIIKRAGIVRSTFYNHFEDIPALVAALEKKTIEDIFSLMETFHPKNDRDICRAFFLTVCEYTKENPFLAGLLQSPGEDAFLEQALSMLHRYVSSVMQNRTPADRDREEFSYLIASAIGSTIGVLHKWITEGFAVPAATVADILTQVFMSATLPYILHQS